MKLLPVLFLCFYCFLNGAVAFPDIAVDCDDSNIFKAVDEALRSYNNAKEDGNQFVLFRVEDAKKRVCIHLNIIALASCALPLGTHSIVICKALYLFE